jgi:transglutaminase-like putative cysteine protease
MRRKWCFRMHKMRATTRFSAIFLAAFASVLASQSPCAAADKAPDWLHAAAQEKLPEYPKQHEAVAIVLLDEQQTTVRDKGEIEIRTRRAYKILRPEARNSEYAYAQADLSNNKKVSFFKAWTILPNGHEIEVSDKDVLERSVSSYEVFADLREKYVKFPEVNPGSVVGYESVEVEQPYVYDQHWYFQEVVPVHRSRLIVQLPNGWEFRTFWANHAEQDPQNLGSNRYQWEIDDSPAIEIEPQMPAWNAIAIHLGIKYYPSDAAMRMKSTGSWKEIGLWYNDLTTSTRTPTPEIKEKVAQLTSGLSDPVAKMKVLASFAQWQIRYAAIEIGIGGYQPHPAADIYHHMYGDCKDKATLLSAMLNEIGIESYYVLINTRRRMVYSEFPMTQFDHAILAVKLPDGVPDSGLFAVVKDSELGRLLFFDPTNPYVPLGYLPTYLQDNYGLVAGPKGGELIELPLLPPQTNRLIRTGKASLGSTGKLDGAFEEVRWGSPAHEERERILDAPPANRAKVIEEFLGHSLSDFTLTKASIGNLEQYDQNLMLDYRVAVDGYAKIAGNLLILRPRIVGSQSWSILSGKPRKYPIEFPETARLDDVFDITLPEGYVVDELPKAVDVECSYGSYKSQVQVAGNTLHYTRTYEIKDVYVPTQNLDKVKTFLNQIAADEHASAILRRATP